eukprot:TRINITY_DN18603_c0_g1_i1.p1 TRINITY_DN18603_c0_g1~~TRINITY_DN18603_c0_g1_i1.p1  ORF type:complete len:584 (-),score=121.65 TRINITY_DN18603_c0_g1_i1:74-1825(-)
MHRYLFCMILLYKLLPSDAVSCSYPRLSETCEKIASSEESDWNKVNKWETVLSSIDLSHINCDEDIIHNSQKSLIKVTSASDYSPFEFKFTGSVDENKKFAGQGLFSYMPSTVYVRNKLWTPEIQNLSATFVKGVPEGVAAITHANGATEKVFLKHGVAVGLGINSVDQVVGSYNGGIKGHPVWRFVTGVDVVSVELDKEFVVFARVLGVERILMVRGGEGYQLNSVRWNCDRGLLKPDYNLEGYEKKYELIKEFPPVIDEKDQILYQMIKFYIDKDNELKHKEEVFKDIDEAWIRNKAKIIEKQKIKGNLNNVYVKYQFEYDPNGNHIRDKTCKSLGSYRLLPSSLPVRALVSYPGSGNTWLRDLVEAGTGLTTGDERDWAHMSSQNTHKPGADLLVKSHHMQYLREVEKTDQGREDLQWRMQNVVYFSGGGVLLIRNPYDAIRSSWNHFQEYEGDIDVDVGTPKFQSFALNEAQKWIDLIVDWVLLSPRLVVVHYEMLKINQEREVRRIMKFFGIKQNEDRFMCLENQRFEWWKRTKKVLKKNPYSESVNLKFKEIIEITQKLLKEYHHEPLPIHLYPYQE